jgi:hypothetical protein
MYLSDDAAAEDLKEPAALADELGNLAKSQACRQPSTRLARKELQHG